MSAAERHLRQDQDLRSDPSQGLSKHRSEAQISLSRNVNAYISSSSRTSLYALASCRFDFFANTLSFSLIQFDISVFNYVLSINHSNFYLDYASSSRTRLYLDYCFSSNRSRLYFDGRLGRKVCTQLYFRILKCVSKITLNSIILGVRLVQRDQLKVNWYRYSLRQVIALLTCLKTRVALPQSGCLNTSGSLVEGVA